MTISKPTLKREERAKTTLADRKVTMSNAIIMSEQSLKLTAKRVVSLALAKCGSSGRQDSATLGWVVQLSAAEFAKTYGVSMPEAYTQLKAGATGLYAADIVPERGSTGKNIRWLSERDYHDGKGTVDLYFTAQIAPELLALMGNFTTYRLKQAVAFKSIHTWRLFECLWCRLNISSPWVVSVADFCHRMSVAPSYASDFGQLRRRVLDTAVAEINEKSDLLIKSVKLIKAGRKVTELRFAFSAKKPAALAEPVAVPAELAAVTAPAKPPIYDLLAHEFTKDSSSWILLKDGLEILRGDNFIDRIDAYSAGLSAARAAGIDLYAEEIEGSAA